MEVDVITENDSDLKELVKTLTRGATEEVPAASKEIMRVVRALGGNSLKYRRARIRAINAAVSEVYSPPTLTAAIQLLPELTSIPGFALDLTTADVDGSLWDCDSKGMRERALRKVRVERPQLLIGSHMCTAFCTWQSINNLIRCPETLAAEEKRAVDHLAFSVKF